MKIVILLLFITGCSHLFYQPSRKQFFSPEQFKLTYKDIYFESLDGTKLHSWFFPVTGKAKGTIILFHGNAQNLSTHFMNLAWIIKQGYNLFIFDYRGYGKSEGEPDQKGIYEDALAALGKGRELNLTHGGGLYIVYGQSLGGIISMRALADYKDISAVDLIVQDSTFSSYKKIAFDRMTSRWFLYPLSPLAYLTVSDEYASDKIIHCIKNPTLVIVGQKDPVIPQSFGKQIFKEIGSKKKWLWKLPEGVHIDVFHGGQESYREKFLQLLESIHKE